MFSDILISHGLSSLIGSDNTRPSKRSRPNDIDDDDHSPVNSPSSNTSPLGACETAPPNLAYQSPNTANVTNNDTPPRWPKASVLRAFPVRVSDGVIRKTMATETYASITVSYGKDPTKAFLVLNVTRKLATILAQELFGKQIRYHEEEAKWVLEMSDGMEIVINGQISFERARVEPIETLFGLLISTAFQNNPKRMDELANGHSLTRLLTLSLDSRRDRTDQVRIALDAVMLSGLECQLWEKYPKQQF